jgi:uncharacterized ion transporter superfamily protein YfcC
MIGTIYGIYKFSYWYNSTTTGFVLMDIVLSFIYFWILIYCNYHRQIYMNVFLPFFDPSVTIYKTIDFVVYLYE